MYATFAVFSFIDGVISANVRATFKVLVDFGNKFLWVFEERPLIILFSFLTKTINSLNKECLEY